ncbi:MAG: glycosyltransferase, partial [Planctomycetota bacterium]
MRLLVVTAAHPGPADPVRAVWVENLNLALHRPPELEVTVVAPRVARTDPLEELRRGIRVRRFPYPGGRRLKDLAKPSALVVGAYLFSAFRASLSESRRLRPHAILCHWVLPAGPAAALAARAARTPLIVVAHGSDVNRYARSYRVGRVLARFAVRSARTVVAVSEDLRCALVRELGADPARTRVVPMGIDAALFRREELDPNEAERRRLAARARLGLDPSRRVLLFVGDLIEEKGLKGLLAAHRALADGGLAAALVLAGEGPLRAAAESEAPRAGARVRPLGGVPQAA